MPFYDVKEKSVIVPLHSKLLCTKVSPSGSSSSSCMSNSVRFMPDLFTNSPGTKLSVQQDIEEAVFFGGSLKKKSVHTLLCHWSAA